MTTYKSLQLEVKTTNGFVPKTCEIAHCLEISGKRMRSAWNRIDQNKRKHPCPPQRQTAILQAIWKLDTVAEAR
jgi:hypothetical protein